MTSALFAVYFYTDQKQNKQNFCKVSILRQAIGLMVRKVRTFTPISRKLIPTFTTPKVYEYGYKVNEIKYELSVVSYKAYADLS